MSSNFESSYVSCGCNKTTNAGDWGRNGLICFGSCDSVAIYDPNYAGSGKILETLHGHKALVKCARWLRSDNSCVSNSVVSASADDTVRIWSWNQDKNWYECEQVLSEHTNVVNVADGLIRTELGEEYEINKTPLILASASADSTVKIWKRSENEAFLSCIDTINWGSGFCLDVRLTNLPYTSLVLLACAADDNKIHLFTELANCETTDSETLPQEELSSFVKVHVLCGHEDWVRGLDFMTDKCNDLYLASCSQDTFIRIWKFSKRPGVAATPTHRKVVDLDSTEDITPEENTITVDVTYSQYVFNVTLETVLSGHENWVYSVSWCPPLILDNTGDMKSDRLKLLSASLDKTMIIWSPDKCGLWTEEIRVGEVGGNTLGFYGGKFNPCGTSIMGHSYQGSFHIWTYHQDSCKWLPSVVVGGHCGAVTDLAWSPDGSYLLSVGVDQTTRLHAPWVRSDTDKVTWHEMARPQVHGYDMETVCVLTPYKFVSGAEEKVIRVFTAPENFIENFKAISRLGDEAGDTVDDGDGVKGAAVPALGLSNKAIYQSEIDNYLPCQGETSDLYFTPLQLTAPPTEENLVQNTLWPEVQKLYGHGYEIYCLTARPDGRLIASSCKATNAEHAAVNLWNTKTWMMTQKLTSHQLTVTDMQFSHTGAYLLTVSRDRRWSLFKQEEGEGGEYQLYAATDKSNCCHTRIIWCCGWTHDSLYFATGSRDGRVAVWGRTASSTDTQTSLKDIQLMASQEMKSDSVTAVAFAPVNRRSFYIMAVGLESGKICLMKYFHRSIENLWINLDNNIGHHLMVKKLRFRPVTGRAGSNKNDSDVLQLASCGSDFIVKIFDLFLQFL